MTREVISLPADADAAQAARLLLERRIAQVPIVAGRRVVGILARRDLLRVPTREDADIEGEVGRLLAEELGEPVPLRVSVHNGVVELTGDADASARRLAALLARSVPGVVDVHVNGPRS
jgi:CBS domain-containing protein